MAQTPRNPRRTSGGQPVPPTPAPNPWDNLTGTTVPVPTPTPTTIPSVTPTTVPGVPSTTGKNPWESLVSPTTGLPKTTTVGEVKVPRTTVTDPEVLRAQRALNEQTAKAIKAGVPTETVQEIVEGKERGLASRMFGGFLNWDVIPGDREFRPIASGLKNVVAPTLGAISTFQRGVLSGIEEVGDALRSVSPFAGGTERYTAYDYIPVHPQTGLPIAKAGDPVIRNWEDIINAPIPGIENVKTPQEAQAAQDKLINDKARTSEASIGDIKKATKDFSYSASDVPYIPETGNKYVDGIIDFGYDIVTDPLTYATLGGSAVVESIASVALRNIAEQATESVAKGVTKAALRELVEKAVVETGQVASKAAVEKSIAEALEFTTRELIAAGASDAAIKTTREVAEEASKRALKFAPTRVYGRSAREALANTVATQRQSALAVLNDLTTSATEKAIAKEALDVLTPELIQEIAAKGYSVIRGNVAKQLGVKSGARIGLPGFGKITIPYSAKLTEFVGTALTKPRYALFKTETGQKLLEKITPLGRGGLFGDKDILMMRNALRGKTVSADVAKDYVQLLNADRYYRGVLNRARRRAGAYINFTNNKDTRQIIRNLSEHLSTPPSEWAARGLRALTPREQVIYNSVKNALNTLWKEANTASTWTGASFARVPDYFPRTQSQRAIQWAAENVDAASKAAADIGVDRTFFLGNFTDRAIGRGKVWFGRLLDGTETTADLNRIARESGVIDFDFFEMDPVRALAAYAENTARYVAYADAIGRLTTTSPAELGGLARDLTSALRALETVKAPSRADIVRLREYIEKVVSAETIQNWSISQWDALKAQIDKMYNDLINPLEVASGPFEGVFELSGELMRDDFMELLFTFEEGIKALQRAADAGLVTDSIRDVYGSLLKSMVDEVEFILENRGADFERILIELPVDSWKGYVHNVLSGFDQIVLNEKTIPDVAVRAELIDLFKNVKRLDDSQFVRAAQALMKDYNTFFKSYVTLSPGFHMRNALSNTFMMVATGADIRNLTRSLKVFRAWKKAQRAGKTIDEFITDAIKRGIIKTDAEATGILRALEYSTATGYGQFGEIAAEAGLGRPGVLGQEATGRIPFLGRIPGVRRTQLAQTEFDTLKNLSQILGTPIYGSRKIGTLLEEMNRFQLTYDGIMQGYDAATAAARTSKYLIDYNDLSTADLFLKQIIPFWVWATRNVPLQMENMWMNPRAYAFYSKARENLRDKENESPFLRQYRAAAGAFKLPFGENLYLQPDFGFPGAGQPSILSELFTSPSQVLGRVSPVLRVPVELWRNEQFFTGAPITDQRSADANWNKFTYTLRNVGAPASLLGRIINFTPARRVEFLQKITGARAVTDEQSARNEEINSLLSYIGLPVFQQLPRDERAEIWRRFFNLLDETDKAEFQNR